MDCKVILATNGLVFGECANMIKLSLEELGHTAEIVGTGIDNHPYKEGDLNIVTRAFRPYIQSGKGRNVLYQCEELWHSRDSGVYDPRANGCAWERTLEIYKDNVVLPNHVNHKVVWCPYGYSPAYETNLPEVEEDVDIFFFGSNSPMRMNLLSELKNHPAMKGKVIHYATNLFGIERDKWIMRSKIIINLKFVDRWSYPPLRALLAQCKKKMFMGHAPDGGRDPFTSGKHFIEFKSMEHLAEIADDWLNNDKKRKEFAVNAYEDIKKYHRFTDHLITGLKGII